MEIKVIGCNNCEFAYLEDGSDNRYCSLQGYKLRNFIGQKLFINTNSKEEQDFKTDIPKECPAKQGKPFTIKIE